MIILSTGLWGKTLDKFTIANGCGGNGKNVINDIARKAMGNYAKLISPTLVQATAKLGATPEMAELDNVRLAIMREPDAELPFNIAVIKAMTGGDELNGRKCFSNVTKIENKGTFICECNQKPQLKGTKDNAVLRRIVDWLFKSVFTDSPDSNIPHEKPINRMYTNASFQSEMRSAMFIKMLEYFRIFKKSNYKIEVPGEFQQRVTEHFQSNDAYLYALNFLCIKSEHGEIDLKDFYKRVKNSESVYKKLPTQDREFMTKEKFIGILEYNPAFKHIYKKKQEIITNYRFREDSEFDAA